MNVYVKGTDKQFHLCKILGVCTSYTTIFPIAIVESLKGFPFNENRTAQVEMRGDLFFYAGRNSTATPKQSVVYRTAGLANYKTHQNCQGGRPQ